MDDHTCPYSEEELARWTHSLWDRADEEERWRYYLGRPDVKGQPQPVGGLPKPLLHIEMECAEKRGCLPKRIEGEEVTLAFLVGDRFEPLLQAIWACRPDRLVPVLNEYYLVGWRLSFATN